ncbi:DUF5908 family protein [Aureivirga marina]|uniref:DUF5908 family protein n=1 Tax=Aureivirga marina TaxID=1182451 RepID=UPI0018C99A0A|nr:DUF5908 family protein [Aureivirga marina]
MPIEIRELHIKVNINSSKDKIQESKETSNVELNSSLKKSVQKYCKNYIDKKLREERRR